MKTTQENLNKFPIPSRFRDSDYFKKLREDKNTIYYKYYNKSNEHRKKTVSRPLTMQEKAEQIDYWRKAHKRQFKELEKQLKKKQYGLFQENRL